MGARAYRSRKTTRGRVGTDLVRPAGPRGRGGHIPYTVPLCCKPRQPSDHWPSNIPSKAEQHRRLSIPSGGTIARGWSRRDQRRRYHPRFGAPKDPASNTWHVLLLLPLPTLHAAATTTAAATQGTYLSCNPVLEAAVAALGALLAVLVPAIEAKGKQASTREANKTV